MTQNALLQTALDALMLQPQLRDDAEKHLCPTCKHPMEITIRHGQFSRIQAKQRVDAKRALRMAIESPDAVLIPPRAWEGLLKRVDSIAYLGDPDDVAFAVNELQDILERQAWKELSHE